MQEGTTDVVALSVGESVASAEALLRTATFQQRMEEARRKREHVLSRAPGDGEGVVSRLAPSKPWERQAHGNRTPSSGPEDPHLLQRVTREPELFRLAQAAPGPTRLVFARKARLESPAPEPAQPLPAALPLTQSDAQQAARPASPLAARLAFGFTAGIAVGVGAAWFLLPLAMAPGLPEVAGPAVPQAAVPAAAVASVAPQVSAAATPEPPAAAPTQASLSPAARTDLVASETVAAAGRKAVAPTQRPDISPVVASAGTGGLFAPLTVILPAALSAPAADARPAPVALPLRPLTTPVAAPDALVAAAATDGLPAPGPAESVTVRADAQGPLVVLAGLSDGPPMTEASPPPPQELAAKPVAAAKPKKKKVAVAAPPAPPTPPILTAAEQAEAAALKKKLVRLLKTTTKP